jgi:CBS domain-containing protein
MSLDDLMRETVVTTATDTSVSNVAATMRDENVGSVVVVAADAPVGVVTDRISPCASPRTGTTRER